MSAIARHRTATTSSAATHTPAGSVSAPLVASTTTTPKRTMDAVNVR
jgi:hypothetical protein